MLWVHGGRSKINKERRIKRQLLELEGWKFHGQIKQRQLIMIISTAIQNIPAKVCTYYFADTKLHPHHSLSFSGWINNIEPDVKTG